MEKKLYRSATDSMLTGVCGGLGKYLEIDSTVLRLIWVVVVVFTGFVPGVLIYLLAILIIPLEPKSAEYTTPKPVSETANAPEVKAEI